MESHPAVDTFKVKGKEAQLFWDHATEKTRFRMVPNLQYSFLYNVPFVGLNGTAKGQLRRSYKKWVSIYTRLGI